MQKDSQLRRESIHDKAAGWWNESSENTEILTAFMTSSDLNITMRLYIRPEKGIFPSCSKRYFSSSLS
jgi:hypothetical protein